MGGRDIKIVRSPYVWDWSLGEWRENPYYKMGGIILKGLSAAISIQGIWQFINYSRQAKSLEEMEKLIEQIRLYRKTGDIENIRFNMLGLIESLRKYFEPIAPSGLHNIMWKRIAEEIKSR
jgi:hypothetical protein